MSATTHGASAGIVLGFVSVVFGQQLGWFNLSDLVPAIEYLVLGIAVGGALGAGIGYALGRRRLRQPPSPVTPWVPGSPARPPSEASAGAGASDPTDVADSA